MKRFLLLSLTVLLVGLLPVKAQNEVVLKYDYAGFKGVEISGNFKMKYISSPSYSVKLTVDKLLEEYTKAYVKNGTLHVFIDTKALTPELKKAFKGRNAIVPVLEAEVYAPKIEELYLSGNVVLRAGAEMKSESISINMFGASCIENLKLDAGKALLKMEGNSKIKMSAVADSIKYEIAGSANADIENNTGKAYIAVTGNSVFEVNGKASRYFLDVESPVGITLKGVADTLSVKAGGNAKILADSLAVPVSDIVLRETAKCSVNATEKLKVDLTGRSSLTFTSNPAVEVVRIEHSTMKRPDVAEKKKW